MTSIERYPSPDHALARGPVVIHADGLPAGFAIAGERGFRFLSAHQRFDLLDGSRFPKIDDICAAARHLADATRPRQPVKEAA